MNIPLSIHTWMLAATLVMTGANAKAQERYPNELENFKLYAKYCPGIEPGKSTRQEVYEVMGKQTESEYRQSHIWYEKDDWQIIVYLYTEKDRCPAASRGRVQSIDFIPKQPMSFKEIIFPGSYKQHWGQGCDAAWWEYHDAHGLVYCIYTTKAPFGKEIPGDLNRISYRAAPEDVIRMQDALLKSIARDGTKQNAK